MGAPFVDGAVHARATTALASVDVLTATKQARRLGNADRRQGALLVVLVALFPAS